MEKFPQIIADAVTARNEFCKWNQSKIIELLDLIATNLDSIAYISINEKSMKLNLVERKFDKNSKNNENYTEIFANEKFKATLEIKIDNTKKRGDEVWWSKGSIKIENKSGKTQTKKFIGECGC